MRNLMRRLWRDDCGGLIAGEWLLVATIIVIGCITGLVAVRKAINEELDDIAKDVFSMRHHHGKDSRDDDKEQTTKDDGGDDEGDGESGGNGNQGHGHDMRD
jgi:Flp pilus assembly pilin Flp